MFCTFSCRMRSLETAAQAGVVIVVALAGIIATEAAQYGFPAIRNGELPLWGIKVPATYPFLNISVQHLSSYCQVSSTLICTAVP